MRVPAGTSTRRAIASAYRCMSCDSVVPGRSGWAYKLDGLQHIGLDPDLLQDMRNVGAQWKQMDSLFHAAGDHLVTWRRGVAIGAAHT